MRDLEQKFKFSFPSVKNGNYRFHVSLFFLEVDRDQNQNPLTELTHRVSVKQKMCCAGTIRYPLVLDSACLTTSMSPLRMQR